MRPLSALVVTLFIALMVAVPALTAKDEDARRAPLAQAPVVNDESGKNHPAARRTAAEPAVDAADRADQRDRLLLLLMLLGIDKGKSSPVLPQR